MWNWCRGRRRPIEGKRKEVREEKVVEGKRYLRYAFNSRPLLHFPNRRERERGATRLAFYTYLPVLARVRIRGGFLIKTPTLLPLKFLASLLGFLYYFRFLRLKTSRGGPRCVVGI